MSSGWRVGVDIGGTFMDVVASRGEECRVAKLPAHQGSATLGEALATVGVDWQDVDDLVHGTTVITNAIVEDHLAPVALIATRGFADTLAIGRQNRTHLYRLDLPPKPSPQVPAGRRFEVDERVDAEGRVLLALDHESLDAAVRKAADCGAEAVAVALLHSYLRPDHEEQAGAVLQRRFNYVALSHDVNPEEREYERTAATVLTASLMPLADRHIESLTGETSGTARIHLFHSAGGMASPQVLRHRPLGLALSGPAAGVSAAGRAARDLDLSAAISLDMGGTTTDVCMVLDGEAAVDSERYLAGRSLRQPMVAVESIGAGGGSIARLDHGALMVGPESAGANPGPACYGRGGNSPTVTDASLLLGYLDLDCPMGGAGTLSVEAAGESVAPLAAAMCRSVEQAALGIVEVANAAMLRALRRITVERGVDGRGCALIAFGGAGPMHAVALARAFSIDQVIVPAHSSQYSALGCATARMSHARQQTLRMPLEAWNSDHLRSTRDRMRQSLAGPMQLPEGCGTVEEVACIRYRGQSYAVEVTAPDFDDPVALGRAFAMHHDRQYGFSTDEPWELVALRMRVSAGNSVPLPRPPSDSHGGHTEVRTGRCMFVNREWMSTPRYPRSTLRSGAAIDGPAIVEDPWSTVVLPPGARLTTDDSGHLHIDPGGAA